MTPAKSLPGHSLPPLWKPLMHIAFRPALVLALLAAPAFAQDERPVYQMLEGIEACLLGAGAVDATSKLLTKASWTVEPDPEAGIVDFLPGEGTDTFAFMSNTVGYCHVEAMALGTVSTAGLLELFLAEGDHDITSVTTGTNEAGCATQTLSNGVVVEITSAGNDPVCTSDMTSGLRFLFTGG